MSGERFNLTMNFDTANAVEEALGYYLAAAADNYGCGWDRTPDGREEKARYHRVEKATDRLVRMRERRERT